MIKKVFRWFLIIFFVLILGLITVSEFPQLYIVPFTKYKLLNVPGVYETVALRILEPARYQNKNFREFPAFDYSLILPWQEEGVREKRNTHSIVFQSENKKLIVFDEGPDIFQLIQDKNGVRQQDIASFYGQDVTKSRYEFYRYILNTTPNDLKIFAPKRESLSKSTLVIYKSIILLGEGPFYEFDTGRIRGFQYGNLGEEKTLTIDFFTPTDKEYKLLFNGIEDQGEIDFILNSIKAN